MKIPNIKLPLYIEDYDYLDIVDSEDVIIATFNSKQNNIQDANYVVKAANKFPEALELLKLAIERLEINNCEESEECYILQIEQFLNSLGDD